MEKMGEWRRGGYLVMMDNGLNGQLNWERIYPGVLLWFVYA